MTVKAVSPVRKASKRFKQTLAYLGQLAAGAVLFAIYFFEDRKTLKITSSGQEREYLLYVPRSYDPSRPAPLVVTLHGFAEWPAHVMRISGWNKLAETEGFLVVYPAATGFPKHWRIIKKHEMSNDPMVEVKFISDLLNHLEETYNIDRKRIFANGFSNGGGMTHVLGEELSGRIAALGIVAGALMYPVNADGAHRRLPLIAFHGTDDPIVPFSGGPSRYFQVPFPSITAWLQRWSECNGCSPTPVQIFQSANVSGVQYPDPVRNQDVVFYTVSDGGHAWPGGTSIPRFLVGKTTSEIDATRLMWHFFEQHPLDNNTPN